MIPLGVYPTEHRLRSAIIFIFLFEAIGCIYQFVAHIWWAASINVLLAILVLCIGLTAAYRKSEGGLLFYAILQMVSVVLQLANLVWVVLAVWVLSGPPCEEGWHCHGWHRAKGWAFAIFMLSLIATLFYLFLKIYAAALALRLRDQVHTAHIAEAFVAPRPYEAAYQSYHASQPSYQGPPRSPVVSRPEPTTYGTTSSA